MKITVQNKERKEFSIETPRTPNVSVLTLSTVETEIQTMTDREAFLMRQIEVMQEDLKNTQDHKNVMQDIKKEMLNQLK